MPLASSVVCAQEQGGTSIDFVDEMLVCFAPALFCASFLGDLSSGACLPSFSS